MSFHIVPAVVTWLNMHAFEAWNFATSNPAGIKFLEEDGGWGWQGGERGKDPGYGVGNLVALWLHIYLQVNAE